MDRVRQLENIQLEAKSLFSRKNKDYGDAFATYGAVGVLVRIGDKMSRYTSISNSGIKLVDNEALRDTLIDLHNYAAMAIMLIDEEDSKFSNEVINEIKAANKSNVGHAYLKPFIDRNIPMVIFKMAECEPDDLRSAGFSAKQLKEGNYSIREIKEAGYTIFEMLDAGCTASEMRQLNICNYQLHTCGYTIEELYGINASSIEEEEFVNTVYTKKYHELRKYYDEDVTKMEDGDRINVNEDINRATEYANEARKIYKEYMKNKV